MPEKNKFAGQVMLTCPNSACKRSSFLSNQEWRKVAFTHNGNDPHNITVKCPYCKKLYSARDWARILEREAFTRAGLSVDPGERPVEISEAHTEEKPESLALRLL